MRIDGYDCNDPGPLRMDMHNSGYSGFATRLGRTLLGVCRATSNGIVSVGNHEITVHEHVIPTQGTHGDPSIGFFEEYSTMEVIEIPFSRLSPYTIYAVYHNDQAKDSFLGSRDFTFSKTRAGEYRIRVMWYDNFGCSAVGTGVASCIWTVMIDEEPCRNSVILLQKTISRPGPCGIL